MALRWDSKGSGISICWSFLAVLACPFLQGSFGEHSRRRTNKRSLRKLKDTMDDEMKVKSIAKEVREQGYSVASETLHKFRLDLLCRMISIILFR